MGGLGKPERTGYQLTEEGEQWYQNWLEFGGCTCWMGHAPCSSCTDIGNPLSLENDDEAWEPEPDKPKWTGLDELSPFKYIYERWLIKQEGGNNEMSREGIVKVDLQNANNTCVGIEREYTVATSSEVNGFKQNNVINKQEETNMSNANRRVVNVKLLDNDSGLPVECALVAQFQGIVTEDSDATVINEILLNKNVANMIAEHNKKRMEQTDLEILKRTGNDVKLRQVKLKDLTWVVTTA